MCGALNISSYSALLERFSLGCYKEWTRIITEYLYCGCAHDDQLEMILQEETINESLG